MNKRGSLSIEMLVLIILALIVLVAVGYSFSTGFLNINKQISGIASTIPEADRIAAKSTCDTYCEQSLPEYCQHVFAGSLQGKTCNYFTTCSNTKIDTGCVKELPKTA